MKRLLAVLILCVIMLTAVPSWAAEQKSVPAFEVLSFGGGLFQAYGLNGRRCLYDEDGKLVLEAPDDVINFELSSVKNAKGNYEDLFLVDGKCVKIYSYQTSQYGLINKKGKILCECEYDSIGNFSDGIAIVRQDNKYGYINTSGKLISKCQWDGAVEFSNGLMLVKKGEKCSVLNKKGKAIAKGYLDLTRPVDGYVAVKTTKGWGVIDSEGKQVIECKYTNLRLCGNGIVGVREQKKGTDTYSLMTLKGKVLTKKNTWPTSGFTDGLVIVNFEGKDKKVHAGAANKKGKVVLDFGINSGYSEGYQVERFINGIAYIRQIPKTYNAKKSTWGFQDTKGNWVIELKSRKYIPERWLNDKLISIQSLGESTVKYGFMNTKGKVISKCEWDSVGSFVDGLAKVTIQKKSKEGNYYTTTIGYINTKGEAVVPCKFQDYGSNSRKGLAVVQNSKGMAACFNKQSEKVLPAKYRSIVIGDNVIAAVEADGSQMLYFDLKGNPIPVQEPAVKETAPAQEVTPATETAPAEETAPAQEEAPAENTEIPADTGEAA